MALSQLISSLTISLLLVCLVDSYPSSGNRRSRNLTQSRTNVEPRSPVKFPNHKNAQSSNTIRTPQGSWSRGGSSSGEVFVFPGDDTKLETRSYLPKPKCTEGSTFCEKVDNYPQDHVASILRTAAKDFSAMFGQDTPLEIQQRIDYQDDMPLCTSIEQIVYPKSAKNKNNEWLFIINQGNYTQGVRIEKCQHTTDDYSDRENITKPCAFTQGFPLGYETYCKQKYIYRKLIALDSQGEATTDIFQLPSCCSCAVRTAHLSSRSGAQHLMAKMRNSTKTSS
ncbi:protein spaetzle isoform X2 [Cimex lectularius]|uniref:Spaetzle domain-containing protein n=1 Tax=Cimex lectularius TaxID=79782 RepID=A0A8I6SGP4_CIMLE|nr:protein spaetzle isoform X2 [Cimex lectularius]